MPWAGWVYGDGGRPSTIRPSSSTKPRASRRLAVDPRIRGWRSCSRRAHELAASIDAGDAPQPARGPPGACPRQPLSAVPLAEAVPRGARRARSAPAPVTLGELAAILDAAYGVTAAATAATPPLRRAVGGALYPSSSTSSPAACDGARPGHPSLRPARARARQLPVDPDASTALRSRRSRRSSTTPRPSSSISGVFWRSRFKYGLRGYRFALLEAGHVGQNLLLAATALGLAPLPVGGFYDRERRAPAQVDGVNESALYARSLGRPA